MALATIQNAFTPTLTEVQNLHNENQTLRTLLERTQKELAEAKAAYADADNRNQLLRQENTSLNATVQDQNRTVKLLSNALDTSAQEARHYNLLSRELQQEVKDQKEMYAKLEQELAAAWRRIRPDLANA